MPVKPEFWLTPEGRRLLADAREIPSKRYEFSAAEIAQFRRRFPAADAARTTEALGFAALMNKAKATGKLPADFWLFTRSTYEQATARALATYRARRFSDCRNVVEVCTGAGCDAAALSAVTTLVASYEADGYLARLAAVNCAANGLNNVRIVAEEAKTGASLFRGSYDGLWADPQRRSESRRFAAPQQYSPPLDWLIATNIAPVCGIKISPAATVELPGGWAREWLGVRDECREQTLWRGTDVRDGSVYLADIQSGWTPPVQPAQPGTTPFISEGGFIIEPHAVIIRSGHIASWLAEQSAVALDRTIAYGYATRQPEHSPFAAVFEVISVLSFSLKSLREAVILHKFTSDTEIKKRGFPEETDTVRKKLKFSESGHGRVIILTRHNGHRVAILCRRIVR